MLFRSPYTISFDLPAAASANYELVLDMIFTTGAPQQFKVRVNDKTGVFPIRPVSKHSVWGEQGNDMLLAEQRLVVPIAGDWLKARGNQISLIPLGVGNLSYDAIVFQATVSASASQPRLEPTIFYRKQGGRLVEVCNVVVPFDAPFEKGEAKVRFGRQTFTCQFTSPYDFGVLTAPLSVPANIPAGEASVEVQLDGQRLEATCDFKPTKQWRVFVCPKVHNDVGYTDLQPHVNEQIGRAHV